MIAKQLADLITFLRLSLLLILPWLAIIYSGGSLPWAGVILALNWTGDSLDGRLARRSGMPFHTWIGDHDLEVDMSVSLGMLIFLVICGFARTVPVMLYAGSWAVYFRARGVPRSMGMLCQAPVYAWFIGITLREAPLVGWGLIAWILVALVATWPRFPQEVIPDFLAGLRNAFGGD